MPSSLFQRPAAAAQYEVRCLVPDLPAPSALLPYLERIQQNRWYSNFGPLLHEYEGRLAAMTGVDVTGGDCVTLSSGTAALELAIGALALPQGSRVLLPAFTFPATLLAVLRCGLRAVLCDVCPETWTLTPDIARQCLQYRNCRVALPVAAFGLPLAVDAWDNFASETGVSVLIDAAAALGAQRVGRFANVAFSLHATKPLGIGEGGVFATSNAEFAERIRRMSNFGFQRGTVAYAGGTNAKLSEYAAAVGLAQLDRWSEVVSQRGKQWLQFRSALSGLSGVQLQVGFDRHPPAAVAAILPAEAGRVADSLAAAGIETRRWYFPPLHRHPSFAGADTVGSDGSAELPVTEDLASRILGLPFHTSLSNRDMNAVAATLRSVLATLSEK